MALRDKWTFPYKASVVAEATRVKIDFHTQRIETWKAQREKVMGKIRQSGLEIKESLGAGMGKYSSASNFRGQVMVKTEYQQDIDECAQKIADHTDKLRRYVAYELALYNNPAQTIELDVDDIQFFFEKI